ncbi:MAG TPA: hypothetical protein VGW10_01330 [Solirubrobacteraceae bacterium]|nr:hypothetical protein [Solirubrobacteraceae bacterium]
MNLGPRKLATAFLTGTLMVSTAWAGASLVPVGGDDVPEQDTHAVLPQATPEPAEPSAPPASDESAAAAEPISLPDHTSLAEGQVLAGAAKTSIAPRPQDYGGTWETSQAKCATLSPSTFQALMDDPVETSDHLASTGSPWPENPNCIYMGGFGLGPMNPVTSWNEELGLWVRAVALRDRQGDDLVLVVLDGEGWFWDYGKKCDDCGIKQLTAQLAADEQLGLKAENVVFAATHAHSAPDFIGGWGFVPDWYMEQVADTIKSTVRDALVSMRPAVLEYGEHEARPFNSERRDTYRSAEEQQLAWLRAYVPGSTTGKNKKETTTPAETIATVGAYAAHPTSFGTNGGQAHPDWPGLFEKSLEQRFGGVGLHFMTGLGNMSASGLQHVNDDSRHTGADDLAGLIAGIGAGDQVEQPDIRTARTTWAQPVTNAPLTALGVPGFFDRKFLESPATVRTGEDPDKFQCTSTSPVSAEVAASAARSGNEVAVSAAPGEIFSNFSNTMKEQSRAKVTLPLGQANDALGYMPQSFEMSPVGQQGLGFVGEFQGYAFVNYEDAYAIDRCFGDMALETSIGLLNGLR